MAMARLARPGPPLLQFSSCRTGAARPPPPRRERLEYGDCFSSQAAGLVPPAHRRRGESGWSMEAGVCLLLFVPNPKPPGGSFDTFFFLRTWFI